jgi:hypothetical protein
MIWQLHYDYDKLKLIKLPTSYETNDIIYRLGFDMTMGIHKCA